MSCFIDIYRDFPLRCARLWDRLNQSAGPESEDLSVTTMLMVAAAGFATPYEQLKIQEGQAGDGMVHPAFDIAHKGDYRKTLRTINKAFDAEVRASRLFMNLDFRNWRLGYCTQFDRIRDEAEYGTAASGHFESQKSRQVVKILRNALAHNNICAFARAAPGQISHLGFFSEDVVYVENQKKSQGWHVLTTATDSFAGFLNNWFALLEADEIGRKPHLRLVLSKAFNPEDERHEAAA